MEDVIFSDPVEGDKGRWQDKAGATRDDAVISEDEHCMARDGVGS